MLHEAGNSTPQAKARTAPVPPPRYTSNSKRQAGKQKEELQSSGESSSAAVSRSERGRGRTGATSKQQQAKTRVRKTCKLATDTPLSASSRRAHTKTNMSANFVNPRTARLEKAALLKFKSQR
jgi:hypothetical protein